MYFDCELKLTLYTFCVCGDVTCFFFSRFLFAEKNDLSFIETSALDSTNVETAFQNILTGSLTPSHPPLTPSPHTHTQSTALCF